MRVPWWQGRARCADPAIDGDLFFDDYDAARRICLDCPVINPCLAFANKIERREMPLAGVWGGLSPIQRQRALVHPEQVHEMRFLRSDTAKVVG